MNINIDLSNYGGFLRDEYAIGTTSKNSYYPLYSLLDNKRIGETQYMYYKPNLSGLSGISRYNELFETFRSKMYFSRFNFTANDENHFILVMKGYIANHLEQPLLMIGINSFEHDLDIYDDVPSEETKKKLKIFVATELLTNDIYTNIWRKLDREFIQECHQEGIAVEFCTIDTIEKTFFSNEFLLQYNNLTELNEHLKTNVAPLLFRTFPIYDYDNTLGLNQVARTAESIVYTEGNNRNASLIPTDMVVQFIDNYYGRHGSLPERCYFRNNGYVIFTFESDINHMFEPDDIRRFVQEEGPYFVPTPTSLDYETVRIHVPDIPTVQQVNNDVLESSISDVIVSDIPLTEEHIRAIVNYYQEVQPSSVRMVQPIDDERLNIIFGDYTSDLLESNEIEDLLHDLGYDINTDVNSEDLEEIVEEIISNDDFELVDDTESETDSGEVLDGNEHQGENETTSW